MNRKKNEHVSLSPRRLQSQKPECLYKWIETMFPLKKCELIGRHVNLRKNWLTIGNEVIPDDECWIFEK